MDRVEALAHVSVDHVRAAFERLTHEERGLVAGGKQYDERAALVR